MVFPVVGGNESKGYEISNSLRFNPGDSPKLTRTNASGGDRQKFTISFWTKRANIGTTHIFFDAGTSTSTDTGSFSCSINSSDKLFIGGGATSFRQTNRLFRDVSAWYHIVIAVDSTDGTADNRIKIYVNGVQETSFTTNNAMSQNLNTPVNESSKVHQICNRQKSSSLPFDGYMTEFHLIDGAQKAQTDFGKFDNNGVWIPKKYTGTYGTNGFFMEFKQTGTSANSSGIGADTSGNDNHFTPTNLAALDVTEDTCTNNFATLLPIVRHTGTITLSEGNTKIVTGTDSQNSGKYSTFVLTAGKWYWEVKQDVNLNTMGLIIPSTYKDNTTDPSVGGMSHYYAGIYRQYNNTVMKSRNQSGGSNYNSTVTGGSNSIPEISANDIIMFALDMDNGYLYVGTNGTFHNSADPANGTNAFNLPTNYTEGMSPHIEGDGGTAHINFGNPAFSISSGNSDGKYGNFEYSVPSGFYALCTKRLAEFG
jgi:hypothetical protein